MSKREITFRLSDGTKHTIKPGDKVVFEGDSSWNRDQLKRWMNNIVTTPDSVTVGMPGRSDFIVHLDHFLDWLNLGRAQAMRKLGLPGRW